MSTPSSEPVRRRVDRLARLLADERGTEVLAELQKLRLESTGPAPAEAAPPAGPAVVGAWRVRPTPLGPELHRLSLEAAELRGWADVQDVPAAAGAVRVALLGESTARGFLLDPVLTPALAMQRQLDRTGDRFQVVDLAHVGADLRDLAEVARQLPALEPDVVVVLAGNNMARPRHTPGHLDLLATALRAGDYPGMRRAYLDRIVRPGIRRLLDQLAATRARVVLVVPEFNLRGWVPDPELELPPLPPADLRAWADRRAAAEAAFDAGDVDTVFEVTEEMARLDRGLSPVPGWLRGSAALAKDRSDLARPALEASRDAVSGLLTTPTPRITADVRGWLLAGAAHHGFDVVDLAAVLRTTPGAAYPDPDLFLDYCHLSARGIEITAAAVATALVGRGELADGLSGDDRAIGDLLAAVHNSYYAQPRARIEELVRRATADPAGREFAEALHQLLAGSGPVWASPTVPVLLRRPHAARYLAPMLSRSAETLGMWTLRTVLGDVLGPARHPAPPPPGPLDLLAGAEQGLLDGAFRSVTHQPERAYFRAFGRTSSFGFWLPAPAGGRVRLTCRVPAALDPGSAVFVEVNGRAIGAFPPPADWAEVEFGIPAGALLAGTNDLTIHWPYGGADWADRRIADARALVRGDYPTVLGLQGQLFDILLVVD